MWSHKLLCSPTQHWSTVHRLPIKPVKLVVGGFPQSCKWIQRREKESRNYVRVMWTCQIFFRRHLESLYLRAKSYLYPHTSLALYGFHLIQDGGFSIWLREFLIPQVTSLFILNICLYYSPQAWYPSLQNFLIFKMSTRQSTDGCLVITSVIKSVSMVGCGTLVTNAS